MKPLQMLQDIFPQIVANRKISIFPCLNASNFLKYSLRKITFRRYYLFRGQDHLEYFKRIWPFFIALRIKVKFLIRKNNTFVNTVSNSQKQKYHRLNSCNKFHATTHLFVYSSFLRFTIILRNESFGYGATNVVKINRILSTLI